VAQKSQTILRITNLKTGEEVALDLEYQAQELRRINKSLMEINQNLKRLLTILETPTLKQAKDMHMLSILNRE
jgi:hypothetical protein